MMDAGKLHGELASKASAEFVDRPVMDANGNKVGELRVVENAEPDGWVFVNNETKVEIGFAKPQEYSDAGDAVDRFGREYMVGDFGVYFRRNRKLFSCSDESRPEDFD